MKVSVDLPKMNLYGLPINLNDSLNLQPNPGLLLRRLRKASPVTVVVPVYNGGPAVERCLDSLLEHSRNLRIIVIDDASTSIETTRSLDQRAGNGDFELIRHTENWGYTGTVNQGVELAQNNDVILLNSDTVVGPLWALRLRWVAYSRYDVATTTAVSDNAGAVSVPKPGQYNHWQAHLEWNEVARAVAQSPVGWDTVVPTGHGFCMYIRRIALNRVGNFDVGAFPAGYGEENDFCQRAIGAGMVNLLAPHVIVKHARSQSFGESRREKLISEGIKVLAERYPKYGADVSRWKNAKVTKRQLSLLESIQDSVQKCIRVLPRRLYIIHRSVGGTVETNADLLNALADEQESFIFDSTGSGELGLHLWRGNSAVLLRSWKLEKGFGEIDEWRSDYADVLVRILIGLSIELVHVRHLFQHPVATAAEVLNMLGIPRIISTHDFFYISPSITLLDDRAGVKTGIPVPGVGGHLIAHTRKNNSVPMTSEWLAEWQEMASSVLNSFTAMVATTNSAADVYHQAYGNNLPSMSIIEHGRDLGPQWDRLRATGRRPGPLRIAAAANWDPPKGIEFLKEMASSLGVLVEFHALGRGSEQFGDGVVSHGPYNRDSLRPILAEIDPDIMGIFSVWPETYSHTLTESWAFGVPVISTDIGAVAERIRRHGGGWLVPVDSAKQAAELVESLALDPRRVADMRNHVPRDAIRGSISMSRDYLDLYDEVSWGVAKRPRIGFIIRDARPASAHIRLLRRFQHPRVLAQFNLRHASVHDIVFGTDISKYDVLIIQRDAVPSEYVEKLISWAHEMGTKLVLELDDDLVSYHAVKSLENDPYYSRQRLGGIRMIADAASLIIVSTVALHSTIATEYPNVQIVENALDPRLWESERHRGDVPDDDAIRILYMGTKTHRQDFDILVPVMEELRSTGAQVILEVVGIADELPKYPWLQNICVPRGASSYPIFVAWLRSMEERWSIGVAPLVESPINRTKSQLKLLEYAMLNMPVVASDVGPYALANQKLAIRVPNTVTAWASQIYNLIIDCEHSRDIARQSHEYVANNFMLNNDNIDIWVKLVHDVAVRGDVSV